ncbi:hypothetical protein O9G_004194 [Rozella allomycis CSF55]|uniref:Uncharacterized protein n=1 Tax=Rozella allomycis (strain CSF55) TaxID=988480 RepID=A0A075AY48_ROZAC|nr:hypothetical protein O9G_004194 [Rozella allomycis CSF55]|eukprot:EPZ35182.1 hypothetical protein O9G_004194 [Rozella allomycis CSF55]
MLSFSCRITTLSVLSALNKFAQDLIFGAEISGFSSVVKDFVLQIPENAFQYALENILKPNYDLVELVRVIQSTSAVKQMTMLSVLSSSKWTEAQNKIESNAFQTLKNYAMVLNDYNIANEIKVLKGDTEEALIENINKFGADLLIVASDVQKSFFERIMNDKRLSCDKLVNI